ncbi:hypothetical protein ACFV84_16890 [Kitasatospora sp. NPDC059811]|uniref:hypothetical protein n=1 Tax=Streptomycetaceae TaxID=2062 RepID=UPI0007AF2EC7|nr:hypothetical protein [Streptomyces sp. MJM8645]
MTSKRVVQSSVLTAVLALSAALALAPAAQAAAPYAGTAQSATPAASAGYAVRSTKVTLSNQTSSMLYLGSATLAHGCWTAGSPLPPSYILPNVAPSWKTESCGFLTGTEGQISFGVDTWNGLIHWSNPYAGSNINECTVGAGLTCEVIGGKGNTAEVTFVVRRA